MAGANVRPGIVGTKACTFHGFIVAALEVIHITVRRCGAFLVIREARGRPAISFWCVWPSPPVPCPPHPITTARSQPLAGVDEFRRTTSSIYLHSVVRLRAGSTHFIDLSVGKAAHDPDDPWLIWKPHISCTHWTCYL